ncbi:MAG: deferrochelatase/peroxidase EfeB [Leptolyngbyaceae cyanobacterium CRU_2_3]|nr:deferrochelatase/peroxidase EfeB [Leptolyngbyaceae cyanobacterium CRU_2_3]
MSVSHSSNSPVFRRLSRRDVLLGMIGAGGAAALASLGYRSLTHSGEIPATAEASVPFFGLHQAGITTPSPASALMVAFKVTPKTRADLTHLFQRLTDRIEFLMAGGTPQAIDPKFPPADSGILGPRVYPDNLTITVALGASLFDQRFGLAHLKPRHLAEMPSFPNDQLDPDLCHGDLMLQFCANTAETNLHALRDILKNLSDALVLSWKIEGFQQPNTLKGEHQTSVRNLLGFKDGTANLNPQDQKRMDQLVWVQAGSEPAWTTGGSYQVVRVVRNLVERWDRTPLQEQEQIIGRKKDTGAVLGYHQESDIPNYDRDRKGQQIPLDAHIRLANPRKSDLGLILRRGFNYSRSFDNAGQLDMGLLFVCFQSNLQTGFITVQERLNGEPLEEYIKPIGGGYFFALPGVPAKGQYLGQALLEAV